MRLVSKALFLVLASGMVLAQANPPAAPAATASVSDELQQLRQALAEQQKFMLQQQQQMAQQQQQMTEQQQKIDALQKALEIRTSATPHVENASLNTTNSANGPVTQSDVEKPKESPLSFRIGGTEFTPGGFVDFENVFRSTNTAGNITTPFGGIPFSNTVAGHLTEFRTTGQYSRYNLKITGHYGENNVTGYIEGDFNGNDANTVFVTSNPHTNRLRLYWMDLKRGNWEFLGGQSWGLQTPNRVGLSPAPSDLAVTLNEDANVNVGIPYTRAGLFRVVYHFNDNFQWGLEMQNPDQFVTGAVIMPAAFSAQLGSQLDGVNGNNATGIPSAFPDLHTKFAWDTDHNGRHFHFEAGGILTSAKITVLAPSNTPTASFVHNTGIGGTFHGAFNYELVKGFRILASGMWGTGAGRYMIGLGPQVVVVPTNGPGSTCAIVGTVATGCSADVSMVHAGAMTIGSELQAGKKTQFGFYYGGNYFQRNAFRDITSALATQPFIGFGGLNSSNSANRAIQEGTIDWTQTFWKNPQYGAVLLVTQASYLTRAPWFVPAGAPKNAHLTMGYVSVRYVLP